MSYADLRRRSAIAGFLASVAIVGVAIAAGPADIIKTRQQGLKDMGAATKVIRDELKSTLDVEKIKVASAKIQKTADDMANWFPSGSGPEAGVKTAAKAEIWADADGFAVARKALVEQSAKLGDAAKSGDVEAIGASFKGVGKSCGGCHEKFRVKED
jgi:cytochrome c556